MAERLLNIKWPFVIDVGQIRWKMSLWVCVQSKLGSAVTVGFVCEMIYLGLLLHSLVVLLERGSNKTQSCLSRWSLPVGPFGKLFPLCPALEDFKHGTFVGFTRELAMCLSRCQEHISDLHDQIRQILLYNDDDDDDDYG